MVFPRSSSDVNTLRFTSSQGVCSRRSPLTTTVSEPSNRTEPSLSLVHVRDLVEGMVDAAHAPTTEGETYLPGSPQPYAWNEVKRAATDALDTWAVPLPIPRPLVGAIGTMAEAWGSLTGTYPPLNRDKARELRHACTTCTIDKAARDFDYTPSVPLASGIAATIDWYRDEGWL